MQEGIFFLWRWTSILYLQMTSPGSFRTLVLEQKYKTESVPYNNVLYISFPLFTFQVKPLPPLKDLDQPAHFLLTVTPAQP